MQNRFKDFLNIFLYGFLMKRLSVLITALCYSTFSLSSEECTSQPVMLDPSSKPTSQQLLNWVDSSRKTAQCLGIEGMSDSFDDLELSIRAQEAKKSRTNSKQICHTAISNVTISDTMPFYPDANWKNASGLLWKKPYYDMEGVIAGYDESILLSMRPDFNDVNKPGRIYVAFSSEDNLAFLDSSNRWQQRPEALACTSGIDSEQVRQNTETHINDSNYVANNLAQMPDLPEELKQKLVNMEQTTDLNRKPKNSLPACPPGYEPPDTTPRPYKKDALGQSFQLNIPLGRDATWCPKPGPHNLLIGYGVLTNGAKNEIQDQMTFGDESIARMEEMIAQASSANDGSPSSEYWLKQMKEQLPVFRAQAQKIQYQARAGITENRLVYQNGYQQQTCWQVFSYNCPSISEDL